MSENNNRTFPLNVNPEIIEYLILFLGLLLVYITSLYRYLLFHSIAEIFSIIIAGGVFFVGWNSRRYMKNSFFLILGVSSLFIGIFDLIHTFSYTGMQIFLEFDANLPTSLWIAARYLQAGSILTALLLLKRTINPFYLLVTYFLITIILLTLIFNNLFPICYIENYGLTPFKIISEYVIDLVLLVSLLLIIRNRKEFDKKVLVLIVSSIVSIMIAELAFTFYINVYGFSNLVGHIFKIIAFYLLYKSVIQIGIEKPFDLLLRQIKRSELELRNIIDHSGAGITMLDENGIYLLVNEKAASELGGIPEDFIGKTLHDVLPQKLADEYMKSNQELIREGRSRSYQRTFDIPVGRKTYWIVEQPIEDYESKFPSLLSVATEITELKKAEEEIKKREYDLKERVKELTCFYNVSKLIEKKDISIEQVLEETLRYLPPAWQYPEITCARIFYKGQELTTANFRETKWVLKANIREYGKTTGAIEVLYLEERLEFEEGPFFKEERFLINGISEMIATFIERKKAEEEILNLSKFPSENPNPVLRVNNQKVIYSNKIGKKLFNISEDNLIPRVLEKPIYTALTTKKNEELEVRLNSRTYTLAVTPVENMDYVNVYGLDITERKKAEQKISQLISTVSHELRTPITVLLMSIEYLTKNKSSLNKELEEKLMEGISRNIQLLNKLAEDILLISRIDENRLVIEREEYNPLEIINEILYLMEPIGKEKNIDFEIEVDDHLHLRGDSKRIDQIFRILIENALKYSNENSKIEINAIDNYQGEYNLDGNKGVLFQFKDHGRGISKEDIPHIFERFFRGSNVDKITGTGLGLAIAKDLIEAHQGKIYIESELEKGTTINLFLPQLS